MWLKKSDFNNNVETIKKNLNITDNLNQILHSLNQKGHQSLIVGGAIRDALLGKKPKDIDVEVYGMNMADLAEHLKPYGHVDVVGAKFGIIKLREFINFNDPSTQAKLKQLFAGTSLENADFYQPQVQQAVLTKIKEASKLNPKSPEYNAALRDPDMHKLLNSRDLIEDLSPEYDFGVPRKDSKTGVKHTDFDVQVDPDMTPKEAFGRRDLTINAIGYNPINEEIHDYYGGVKDLHEGVLRATTPAFAEDPLRVWRIMQFATRLKTPDGKMFTVDPQTAKMSQAIAKEYLESKQKGAATLPKERIEEEFNKALLKGKHYDNFFEVLAQLGLDQVYPQLGKMTGVQQDQTWHPEGNVDIHTQHTMNYMKQLIDRINAERAQNNIPALSNDEVLVRMYSMLLHDAAKPHTTYIKKDKEGRSRITSPGHEHMGGDVALDFLNDIGVKKSIIRQVEPLIRNHMAYLPYMQTKNTTSNIRKLAEKLHPANIETLIHIIEADHSGRPPLPQGLKAEPKQMWDHAKKERVDLQKMPPIIKGEHVQPFYKNHPLGVQGKHIGQAVQDAHQAWLQAKFHTHDEGMEWMLQYLRPRAALLNQQNAKTLLPTHMHNNIRTLTQEAWQEQINAAQNQTDFNLQNWIDNHPQNQNIEL